MDSDNIKLVNFDEYCKDCKFKDLDENDIPCRDCIAVPARENSHKPEKFEKK